MKYKLAFAIGFIILLLTLMAWAQTALEITISGISDANVIKNVNTTLENMKTDLPFPITKTAVLQFKAKAPDAIKKALQPYGYFRAKVSSTLQYQNHQWKLSFHITPGPQMKITRLDIRVAGQGQHDPAFIKLLKNFPLQTGQFLNIKNYDDAKNDLFNIASERGYFKASMKKNKIIVNLHQYQATVIIHFNTGPRYSFGKTYFSKTPFKKSFLKRYLAYRYGDPYLNDNLQKTQQNLAESDFFNQVVVSPDTNEASNLLVPINVNLTMRNSRVYSFGLGFGTDTGPRASAGVTYRWINSYGHSFNALIRAAPKNSYASVNYIIPGSNPVTDTFSIGALYGNLKQKNAEARLGKIALSYSTLIGKIKPTLSLTALDERYNLPGLPKTKTQLLYPSLTLQYLSARNILSPKNGISVTLSAAAASKGLLSKVSFSQLRAHVRTLFTFSTHTRLLARSEIGRTDIKDINTLPLSLQLFTGGARTVRGFSYNSIGPGRNLFVGSVEIQQRIFGKWYLGAFYDVGNVADKNLFKNLHKGVGPAIIWLSPVGSVELSFARAISQPNKPWRIQFSIGPDL